jgi:hypothetical protein
MIVCMLLGGRSWGPVFHEVVARQYIDVNFAELDPRSAQAFVQGGTFADALPARFHEVPEVLQLIAEHLVFSIEWWFALGLLMHICVDMTGHGRFLPEDRWGHRWAELVVCSLFVSESQGVEFCGRGAEIVSEIGGSVAAARLMLFAWHRLARVVSWFHQPDLVRSAAEMHAVAGEWAMHDAFGLLMEGELTERTFLAVHAAAMARVPVWMRVFAELHGEMEESGS